MTGEMPAFPHYDVPAAGNFKHLQLHLNTDCSESLWNMKATCGATGTKLW